MLHILYLHSRQYRMQHISSTDHYTVWQPISDSNIHPHRIDSYNRGRLKHAIQIHLHRIYIQRRRRELINSETCMILCYSSDNSFFYTHTDIKCENCFISTQLQWCCQHLLLIYRDMLEQDESMFRAQNAVMVTGH